MAESMNDILHPKTEDQIDPEFPHAPDGWSREKAVGIAQEEGLELTAGHWAVIKALQEYFAKNDHFKARELHDALDESFHAEGGLKLLYELFPGGPVAQGCRIAGLEPPPGARDLSFGSVQ